LCMSERMVHKPWLPSWSKEPTCHNRLLLSLPTEPVPKWGWMKVSGLPHTLNSIPTFSTLLAEKFKNRLFLPWVPICFFDICWNNIFGRQFGNISQYLNQYTIDRATPLLGFYLIAVFMHVHKQGYKILL
jgi:hypothetical protein